MDGEEEADAAGGGALMGSPEDEGAETWFPLDSSNERILLAVEAGFESWASLDEDDDEDRPAASAAAPDLAFANEDVDGTPPLVAAAPAAASFPPPPAAAPARSVNVPDRLRRLNFCWSCLLSFLSSPAFLQEYASMRPFSI